MPKVQVLDSAGKKVAQRELAPEVFEAKVSVPLTGRKPFGMMKFGATPVAAWKPAVAISSKSRFMPEALNYAFVPL